MYEVQICRILASRVIITGIFHRNRKGEYIGVFRYRLGYREGKRSLKWAYFSSGFILSIFKYLRRRINAGSAYHQIPVIIPTTS
jgi:hypothetical protein